MPQNASQIDKKKKTIKKKETDIRSRQPAKNKAKKNKEQKQVQTNG